LQVFSIQTRDAFRDACVTLFRTKKKGLYDDLLCRIGISSDVTCNSLGNLVEAYYAAVNWNDPASYEPFLTFFVEVYEEVPDSVWLHRQELSERLFDDGLYVESGRLKRLPL